jgi:hypothetical protein
MDGMRDYSVNCEDLQKTLREGRGLTNEQSAHIEECEACMEAWLTLALDAKPEVAIPPDFAARVAAELPSRPQKRQAMRTPRHLGLAIAMAMATVLLVVCFSGPERANSWVGLVFVMLVATEVAGLALWLGMPKRLGR